MSYHADDIPDYDRIPLVPVSGVGTATSAVTPVTQQGFRGVVDHLFLTNTTAGIILATLTLQTTVAGLNLPNGTTSQDVIGFKVPANSTEDLAQYRDKVQVPEGTSLVAKSDTAASLNVHGDIHYVPG